MFLVEGPKHENGEATSSSLEHSYSYVTHETQDTEQAPDQEYSVIEVRHSSRPAAHPAKQDSKEDGRKQGEEAVDYSEPIRRVPYPSPEDSKSQEVQHTNQSPTTATKSQTNDPEPYSVLQHKGVLSLAFKKKHGLLSQPTAKYRYSYPGPGTSVDSGKTRQSIPPVEGSALSPHPPSPDQTPHPPAPSHPPPPPPTEPEYGVLEAQTSPPVPPQTSEAAILIHAPESTEAFLEKWGMPAELTELLYDDAHCSSQGEAQELTSRKEQLQIASGKKTESPPTRERSSSVLGKRPMEMYEDVVIKPRAGSCSQRNESTHDRAETGFNTNSLPIYDSVQ